MLLLEILLRSWGCLELGFGVLGELLQNLESRRIPNLEEEVEERFGGMLVVYKQALVQYNTVAMSK